MDNVTCMKSKPPSLSAGGGGFGFQHMLYFYGYVVEEVVVKYDGYPP